MKGLGFKILVRRSIPAAWAYLRAVERRVVLAAHPEEALVERGMEHCRAQVRSVVCLSCNQA